MNCENCDITMTPVHGLDHYQCPSCTDFYFPTSIEESADQIQPTGKTTEFKCPICPTTPLEVGTIKDVQVCFCTRCRGFVIDSESLAIAVRELRQNYEGPDDKPKMIDQEQLKKRMSCPTCYRRMEAHPYYGPGNVVLDSCSNCKLSWLDHGELGRIIRAPGKRYKSAW